MAGVNLRCHRSHDHHLSNLQLGIWLERNYPNEHRIPIPLAEDSEEVPQQFIGLSMWVEYA